MSDLIERLRRWNMAESGGDPTQSVMRDLNDAADRIAELEWLVAYVISGLDDWSDGRISNSVFFTEAAAKRVRALAEKDGE